MTYLTGVTKNISIMSLWIRNTAWSICRLATDSVSDAVVVVAPPVVWIPRIGSLLDVTSKFALFVMLVF